MSDTYKDRPWHHGGHRHKYATSEKHHALFTRDCRRRARIRSKRDLLRGIEPAPVYPVQHEDFD